MGIRRLDNATWGFASNCFVCETSNEQGLRIAFFHDEEGSTVYADYKLDDTFSGAPSYVHGGVTMAVLDEAMAWATIALAQAFALTEQVTITFRRPVRVGEGCRVEARIVSQSDDKIEVEGTVCNADGKPCAEATAMFRPMGPEQAKVALGVQATGDDAGFLRG